MLNTCKKRCYRALSLDIRGCKKAYLSTEYILVNKCWPMLTNSTKRQTKFLDIIRLEGPNPYVSISKVFILSTNVAWPKI